MDILEALQTDAGVGEDRMLVKFDEVKQWYSLEEDIHVEFVLDTKVKGSTLDWVGLFREDWNTFESFIAFQQGFGKAVCPETPKRRRVTFPLLKELVNSLLLDFHYQFVYIDKYLDILGKSPLFRFMLPVKSFHSEVKQPLFNPLSVNEEILLSENGNVGKSYPSTCRHHRHPMYRNIVTTCNLCRPRGHDYFNLKEKAELCYLEYLRLSERVSKLETEISLHPLNVKQINSLCSSQNPTALTNEMTMNESEIRFSECGVYTYEDAFHSNNLNERDATKEPDRDEACCESETKDVSSWGSNDKPPANGDASTGVILRSRKKECARSSSFPQDSENAQLCSNSRRNKGSRKTLSDGKFEWRDSLLLSDMDSPLILKAIIGHQEERIRQLTRLLNGESVTRETKKDEDEYPVRETFKREEQVVKLVRTEQRMLAQILRINNNCEEFTNQMDLAQKQKT